jgi:Txe/YoeB family toxin of Txe-Axe toxin-antitoxin module
MTAKPIRKELLEYLRSRSLLKKWEKAFGLFQQDHRHPSLHTELLEPKWRGIYSFRVDKQYRALFFIDKAGEAEVFQITNHYH